MVTQEKFNNWQESEIKLAEEAGEEMFMGIPDKWFEPMIRGCRNGHVSRMVLKSEKLGRDACLACMEPVRIIPNIITTDEKLNTALGEK